MNADLQIALGGGHAGASLRLDRSPAGASRNSGWLVLACAVLTLPFAAALTLAAITPAAHGGESLLASLTGSGHPLAGRLLALGPVVALLLVAALRVRLHVHREDGGWVGGISARLGIWELALVMLALVVVAVFYGHLLADAFACANGVTRAC